MKILAQPGQVIRRVVDAREKSSDPFSVLLEECPRKSIQLFASGRGASSFLSRCHDARGG